MESKANVIKQGALSGLYKGWSSFLWMMKIILPVSFLTMLLAWSSLLHYLDIVVKPALGLINLPAAAALPLIIGMLTGIYGGIAAMVVLPLTQEQMTLVGVFLLTAHNLVQEGIVQAKSGLHPLKATLFRIGAATATLWLLTPWFAPPSQVTITTALTTAGIPPFLPALEAWAVATAGLTLKAFLIIMSLLTILEILKTSGWIRNIVALLAPLLTFMGLDRKLAMLWLTAVLFGLAYGGAVIVEEVKGGNLSRKELETLHLSIGIHHSLIEDPLLFVALGLPAFWLYVPRLIMAVVAVNLLNFWHRLAK